MWYRRAVVSPSRLSGSEPRETGNLRLKGSRPHAHRHLADRQLHRRRRRAPDPSPGPPYLAQGQGPFGSEFPPTNPSQLFVSNAHDGAGNGTVSAFTAAADGTLASIGSSPFADHQTAPCWVEISHDGQYLFTVNTAVSTISVYSIAVDGSLSLLGSTTLHDPNGRVPEDARLSPDGSTLWVVDSGANAVAAFPSAEAPSPSFPDHPPPAPRAPLRPGSSSANTNCSTEAGAPCARLHTRGFSHKPGREQDAGYSLNWNMPRDE